MTRFHKTVSLFSMVVLVSSTRILPARSTQRVLTLDDAISIALDKSFETKTLGLTLQGAEYGLDAAKGRFKTNAQLNLQTPDFTERVQEIRNANSLPVFNTLGTTRFQSTLDIIQPLPTDGRFTLRSTFYHRTESLFLTETEEDIKRDEFFTSINLQFQQPIFTFNRLKAGFERANLNFERAQRRFKRTELDIVFQVTDAFFRLHRSTRQVEISKEEVERQRGSHELALKKFEAGLIPEVESLQMEVDFARSRNSLLEATGDLTREQDRFKQLIGLELSENVAVDTRFDYTAFAIDQKFAVDQALKNRTEIRELEIEKRLAELDVKQVDSRSEFRIDLLAFLDITGISDPSLTSTRVGDLIESSFDDIGRRPTNKGVTLNMSVPLWDWGVNKNEVAEAQSALDESILTLEEQRKTVAREVRAVISQVLEAQNRLDVLRRSEEIAQKSYDISLARFENGDITSQELALDRDRLTAAKTDFLDAYITYQVAVADLKRKTWWDFENNRSLVED